jgi:PKD repeat protein
MKRATIQFLIFVALVFVTQFGLAQEGPITTDEVVRADFHDVIGPIRNFPAMTPEEYKQHEKFARKERNEELHERMYPFAASALPKDQDAVWQKQAGTNQNRETVLNFAGQNSPYYPPDANGSVGPDHYMQTVNCTYAIWNKSGTQLVAPTNMNTLFSGVPGANYNDGDPLILYDDDADRWLAIEFSITATPYRMLIALSQTDDPTGTWDRWSYTMTSFPDYEKFGIWRDGYYMATNSSSGKDVYVFERDAMLNSEANPQMVGFDNPWRPTTIDGFHTIMPLDNDGPLAPEGTPGLFITINDDAIAGGSDQLWIYELDVDWANASSATFNRVQQLNVQAFDSNFGNTWENIPQQGTSQKLDAIPMILMYRAQYRNFGNSESILCLHTVDLNATNHAGIRWYELQRTSGGQWTVRQQSTYGPDAHHRWMGSISMNSNHEIAIGYSISSSTMKPGIRYTGQSAAENALASGILDIAETVIIDGSYVQSGFERWGDYSNMSVDPVDDDTFWFTTQYIGSGGTRKSQIAAINFPGSVLTANFSASPLNGTVPLDVTFSDLSTGSVLSWAWDFGDGGTSNQQNPVHTFSTSGVYTVSLSITDASSSDTETKTDYITVTGSGPLANFSATPTSGNPPLNVTFTDLSVNTIDAWVWDFGDGGTSTFQNPVHTYIASGVYPVSLTVSGPGGSDTKVMTDYISVSNLAPVADFNGNPRTGVKPLAVTFTDLSLYASSWVWDFGDGATSNNQNPVHTYQNAGSYPVSLTATGAGGSDTKTVADYIVVSEPAPQAAFNGNPLTGEWSLNVQFTDLSTGVITSWSWDFGDGGMSGLQNPMYTYADPGIYNVSLTVNGPGGNTTETRQNYITVVNPAVPLANFEGNPTVGDAPLTVVFTDLSTGQVNNWNWEFGDRFLSGDQDPTHTYMHTGSYTVSLTASGPGGSDTETKIDYIIIPTGINETNPGFVVYPNPAGDNLHANFVSAEFRKIKVYDLNGKLLLNKESNLKKVELNISDLKPGTYTLSVEEMNQKEIRVTIVRK